MLLFLLFLIAPLHLVISMPSPATEHPEVQTVALYYKPTCPYSKRVLDYLKRENIKIPLKDVSKDPAAKEELRLAGGYLIVPCLIVSGQAIYDTNNIIQWLSENRKTTSNLPKN